LSSNGCAGLLIQWLGSFHPVTVHFPVALLLAGAVAGIAWAATGRDGYRFAARYCIGLGAAGAIVSALLGWFLAGFRWSDPYWVRTTHRWLGTATALWASALLVTTELAERRSRTRWSIGHWVLLLGGAGLVGATGFFGGALVHGLDHYRWPAREASKPETSDRSGGTDRNRVTEAEADVVIEMNDEWRYDPDSVTIEVGQTVLWKGVGKYEHTVTADPDEAGDPGHVLLPEGAAPFDSGTILPGETWAMTFRVPGHYRYFCIPHEQAGMIGELTVVEAEPGG